METQPQLSILIRVRNESAALERLLRSLREQLFDRPYEVVVIDNESDDGSARIALTHGATVYSLPRSLFTYGRAINIGIRRCRSDLVMLLSAHVWPCRPDSLQSMVDSLGSNEEIDAAYCVQRPARRIGHLEEARFSMFPKYSCVIDGDLIRQRVADGAGLYQASYFSNSACILRRAAVQRHPMRDMPYAEENAFALDLIASGRRVAYLDSPGVYYEGPFSSHRLYEQARRQTIAEKLIEHAYGPALGVEPPSRLTDWLTLREIALTPWAAARILHRLARDDRYHLGSRALRYDLCSLQAIRGRVVGALSWRQCLAMLDVDLARLTEADAATTLIHQ